jgi:hypothetical protein
MDLLPSVQIAYVSPALQSYLSFLTGLRDIMGQVGVLFIKIQKLWQTLYGDRKHLIGKYSYGNTLLTSTAFTLESPWARKLLKLFTENPILNPTTLDAPLVAGRGSKQFRNSQETLMELSQVLLLSPSTTSHLGVEVFWVSLARKTLLASFQGLCGL